MATKVVIFDWDGTLIDSVEHIADSLHHAATSLGLPPRERSAYRNIIGLGIVEALNSLYPGLSAQELTQIRENYSRYFFTRETTPQSVFSGASELLGALTKLRVGRAVATGKSRRGLDIALTSTGLKSHFEITRCADETRSKPDPTMLQEIIRHFAIDPEEAIMVGDTSYDLEMAQRIGMPAIGVQWGVHDEQTLKKYSPVAIVNSMQELHETLLAGN